MALLMMADIITSPKTISTLALFTVFTPELPVLLNIGPDSQSIIEIAILVCGAMLLLGLGLQVTARHRMTAFAPIDLLGYLLVAVEVEWVAGEIRDSSAVFSGDVGVLVLTVLRALGRICRLITTGWQFVVTQHGSWGDESQIHSSDSVALKVFEVATLRAVLLTIAASITVLAATSTEYAWAIQNPSIEGDMSSLDALQADGQSHAVLTTVAKTIFTKWKQQAKGGEDITLLQLSVKNALVWTYFEVHDVIEPKVVRAENKVLYPDSCVIGTTHSCALLDITAMRRDGAFYNMIALGVLTAAILGVMTWTHSSLREVIVKPVEKMIRELGRSADSLLSFEKSNTDHQLKKSLADMAPSTELEMEMHELKGLDLVDYTVAKLSHFVSRNLLEQRDLGQLGPVGNGQSMNKRSIDAGPPSMDLSGGAMSSTVGGSAGSMASINGSANRLMASAGQVQQTSNAGWDQAQLNEATWRPVSSLATIYVTPVKAGQGPQLGLQAMRDTWGWDILGLRNKEHVMQAATKVFEAEDLLREFNIPNEVLQTFLTEVGGRYLPNPYHNLWHAGDVLYTTWRFIHDSKAVLWLTKLEVFAALIAAYGHDAGHPAVSAGFLIAVRSEIALLHNDKSPLENMHCAILFDVLRNPDAAILAELTGDEWRKLRGIVIAAILGTDMLHHFKQNSDIQLFYEVNGSLAMPTQTSEAPACMTGDPGKRHFIIEMFVHAADISNSAKQFEIARNWAYLVVDEFFTQGEREKDLGLPVSPFMDKDLTNIATLQMNFIEFMVFPLYSSLIMLFPTISPACENLARNVGTWGNKRIQELSSQGTEQDGMDGAQHETGDRDPESIQQEIKKIEVRTEALQQKLQTVLRKSQEG